MRNSLVLALGFLLVACNGDEVPIGSGTGGAAGGDSDAGGATGGSAGSGGTCASGTADCDLAAANGCETQISSDAYNCGACGSICPAGEACVAGLCQSGADAGDAQACPTGYGDCNANATDGCEVNLASDALNCGACGMLCPAGQLCSSGLCASTPVDGGDAQVCGAEWADCDGNSANGCETDLQNDADNCGQCATACPAGQFCTSGFCSSTPVDAGDGGDAPACASGWADCDGDSANGCEVDLLSDASNCGACGNDCGNGESCDTGACTTPSACGFGATCTGCEVVAAGQTLPHPVALDSGYAYWATDDGSVYRVAKSGGAPSLLTTGPAVPFHMAVDSTHVYWTHLQPNGVSKVALAGGAIQTVDTDLGIVSSSAGRFAIAVDSTNVWYDANGVLGYTPKAGGTASGFNLGGPVTFAGIAQDSSSIFGVDLGFNGGPGQVMKVDKTTGATATIAANQSMPVTVAYSSGYVYWAGQDNGTISRVATSGGQITAIATGQEPSIHYIAVDGTSVYWGSSAGYVKKAPVGGGAATVVASGKVCPVDVAVDGTHVYWTNRATGDIMRAVK